MDIFGANFDPASRHIAREGWRVELTPRESDSLIVLANPPAGATVTREMLAVAWGHAGVNRSDPYRQVISSLRRKLAVVGLLILNEHARGWRLAKSSNS